MGGRIDAQRQAAGYAETHANRDVRRIVRGIAAERGRIAAADDRELRHGQRRRIAFHEQHERGVRDLAEQAGIVSAPQAISLRRGLPASQAVPTAICTASGRRSARTTARGNSSAANASADSWRSAVGVRALSRYPATMPACKPGACASVSSEIGSSIKQKAYREGARQALRKSGQLARSGHAGRGQWRFSAAPTRSRRRRDARRAGSPRSRRVG